MSKQTIGERIRELRESQGLSLDALAMKSKVTRDHIGRLERDESSNPRKETIDAIAHALGADAYYIYTGVLGPNIVYPSQDFSDTFRNLDAYQKRIISKLDKLPSDKHRKAVENMIDAFLYPLK